MISELREIGLPKTHATAEAATPSAACASKLSMIAGLFALAIAGQSFAGCGSASAPNSGLPTDLMSPSAVRSSHFLPAVYRPGAEGLFQRVSDDGGWREDASIVGMWRFELVTPDPAGLAKITARLKLTAPIAKSPSPQLHAVISGPNGQLDITS